MAGVAYELAPGVQLLIGKSRDNEGMETGGIEMGVIETGVIEMLNSSREGGAVMVAMPEVMLGDSAEQVSSSAKPTNEYESLISVKGR